MPTLIEPVVVDEVRVSPLCPSTWSFVQLFGEDAHPYRDRDPLGRKELQLTLPIEASGRYPRLCQPVKREVIQNVVLRNAAELSVKHAGNERITACVVVKHPRGKAHR